MGTNYYLRAECAECAECGHAEEALHIGKSSIGWCFSLHVIPESGINSLDDWRDRFSLPGRTIVDEYERRLTPEDMLEIITFRRHESEVTLAIAESNRALVGPNNLLRNPLGRDCAGHGEGAWDLITGEFS